MHQLESRRRKSVPLYVELAGLLRERITTGELEPGAQLPTLVEIQADMGVSRVTVRQAMDMLEAEGLIERGAGRGTFVREAVHPVRERLRLTADIASLLDTVRGGVTVPVTTEASTVERPTGPFPKHALRAGETFRFMRRVHWKDGAPFSLVDLYLRSDVFALAEERFRTEIAIIVLSDLAIPVEAAEQSIVVSSADVRTATQLDIAVNSPIANVHRVFIGEDGTAIYAANIRYRSDFIAFDISFGARGG